MPPRAVSTESCQPHEVLPRPGNRLGAVITMRILMRLGWAVVLLMLLAGCGSINEASGSLGTKPTPSPGAKPAVKKELPWLAVAVPG